MTESLIAGSFEKRREGATICFDEAAVGAEGGEDADASQICRRALLRPTVLGSDMACSRALERAPTFGLQARDEMHLPLAALLDEDVAAVGVIEINDRSGLLACGAG